MDALLVTDDDALAEEVQRLAAAAGATVRHARDPDPALREWSVAPAVLLGGDLAGALALLRPLRRPGVHVLARTALDETTLRAALGVGAEDVVELPGSAARLGRVLGEAAAGESGTGLGVAVLGGSGGCGASVFAAALARSLVGVERRTLLVDLDPWGGGQDRILGAEHVPGVRWDDLADVGGHLGGRELREALPRADDLGLLCWGSRRRAPSPAAAREVWSAALRGHDLVVVDVPRHPDPVAEELLGRCAHAVLVCGDRVAAVSSATWAARRLSECAASPHLVVRERRGMPAEQVAATLELPLRAAMPDQRGLDEALDLGAGPLRRARGPLARAARQVADVILAAA